MSGRLVVMAEVGIILFRSSEYDGAFSLCETVHLTNCGTLAALGWYRRILTSVLPDRDNHGNSPHLRLVCPLFPSLPWFDLVSVRASRIYPRISGKLDVRNITCPSWTAVHFINIPAIPSVSLLGLSVGPLYYA